MAYEVYKNGDGLGRERLVVWDGVGSLPTTHKGAPIDADMPAVDTSRPGDRYRFDGTQWIRTETGGAVRTNGDFIPSSYDTDLTMDGTAQGVALATGTLKVQFANRGATTEAIRVAFGTSELDAEGNLNMTTDGAPEHATTGYYIPAAVDGGSQSIIVLGVPSNATHYAVANAVDSHAQTVSVTQGV